MTNGWDREKLLDLSRTFQKCRILLTAVELNLFDILAKGYQTVEELCTSHGFSPRGLRILLDALASQGLVSRSLDEKYGLEESLSRLLTKDGEDSVLPMILHAVSMWQSWSKLTEIVRTGVNPNVMGIRSRSTEDMEAFIGAMHVIGLKMADSIAESLDLTRFKRMLDIGGASGTYVMAFLKKAPHMTATIFDLPNVVQMAQKRLDKEAYSHRVELAGGDYTSHDLPRGHDLVLLSAIIHSNGREGNRDLFRKIFQALEPGGALLVRDYVMDQTRTFPPNGAIFAVNMLAATSDGNSYTFEEIREDMQKAGFSNISMIRDGQNMDQLVIAEKL
jgi:predicted nicotinamide N-methyase